MKRRGLIFISALIVMMFVTLNCYSQDKDAASDFEYIRSIIANSANDFENFGSIQTDNQVLSTSYVVEVTSRNREGSVATDCSIIYDGERSRLSTSGIVIVQDSDTGIQLQEESRQIVIHDTDGGRSKDYFLQKSHALQKESLKYLNSSERTQLENDKIMISLEFNSEGRQQLRLKRVEYVVDIENERILEASVFYSDNHPNQKLSIKFGEITISERDSAKLPNNILDLIYDSEGELLHKWSGFAVFDNRMKK
ncbi:hypothetical protein [Halocola ammonii]